MQTEATPRLERGQLALLTATMFAAMITLTLPVTQLEEFVSRLLPAGEDHTSLENTAKNLFLTFHFAAYIPFAFVWGAISDRTGKRKPILLIGLLGQGAMFLLMPLVPNLGLLYLARFIEGSFSIATVSMLMTMAVDMAPVGKRGMTLGVFTMGMLLGTAVGAPIGGALARMSYAYPFWVGGVLLFVVAVVVALFVREARAITRSHSFRESLAVFREHPRLAIPYSFSMLDRLTVGFFVGQFTLLANEVYGLDPAERGIYLSVFLLCFALLSPLGGMLSDRLGRVKPMLVATVVYGLLIMLVGRVGPEMLYVVMAAGGVCGAVLYPPSIAMVGDYAGPHQRAVAMGGFNLAGSIGFAVGPILFGVTADAFGILAPPLVAGMLCLIAAAIAAPLLWRTRMPSPTLQATSE